MACCKGRRDEQLGTFGGDHASLHYPPNLELEPVHTEIRVSLDLQAQTAELRVATTVVAQRAGVTELTLDGISFLDLKTQDRRGLKVVTQYDGNRIKTSWEQPFALHEQRTLELSYRVERPLSGLFFLQPTPSEPQKPLYAATDHETELARYWLACIDHPNARTTLTIYLTADASLTLLANGYLVDEQLGEGGTKTAHWQLDQRCPSYLICFAVGDFQRFDDGEFDGRPLAYFGCKDFSPEDLQLTFGRTRPLLEWMTKRLGVPLPFPKYFQFGVPEFGGAMENISLVSYNDSLLLDPRSAPEGSWFTDQVNAHEMAHSYFGDLVVCRDFAHAWLKESWATYMETCWLEHSRGADEQLYDLYCNADSYIKEASSSYLRPLVTRKFTSSWQMYDRHLYPGGACRLHTLRWEIGDELFWRAVHDYLTTHQGQVVETLDFQRSMEKHAGRSLQKFFDQWVYQPGFPQLKVKFSYDKDKQLGTFVCEQTQVKEDDKQSLPPFELKTDLGWTSGGEDHVYGVTLTEARHTFQVPMPTEPEQVRFDPLWKILHKLDFTPTDEQLRRQLTDARDVPGRIHAAQQLCKSGKRANLQAVFAAYGGEPFWGVRREMLQAITATNTEEGLLALVGIIGSEQHPLVLPKVFYFAGQLRDSRIMEALLARHAAGNLAPQAQGGLYMALGRQRDAAPVELLQHAAKVVCANNGFAQQMALRALGESRQQAVVPFLMQATGVGETHYRARAGAVKGLAALVPYLDKGPSAAITELFIDLLRDPDHSVRNAAAHGLGAAQARGAVAAVEAYRAHLPLQEQVTIDPILADLRRGQEPKIASLEEQLHELQKKLKTLTDKLHDLEDKVH